VFTRAPILSQINPDGQVHTHKNVSGFRLVCVVISKHLRPVSIVLCFPKGNCIWNADFIQLFDDQTDEHVKDNLWDQRKSSVYVRMLRN
jgi:hypothetical protein